VAVTALVTGSIRTTLSGTTPEVANAQTDPAQYSMRLTTSAAGRSTVATISFVAGSMRTRPSGPHTHTASGLAPIPWQRRPGSGTEAINRGKVGVLVLSQFLEPEYALMLLAGGSGGVGYLLKDRVADATELLASAQRVAAGGSAIDPSVVDEIVRGRSTQERLAVLTSRERQVMALVAEGRSNRSVAEHLSISVKTVEAQVATIFSKLGLEEHPDDNRRVLAVIAYLNGRGSSGGHPRHGESPLK
jgi:DNA-binding NarL/FixJ family response regulator